MMTAAMTLLCAMDGFALSVAVERSLIRATMVRLRCKIGQSVDGGANGFALTTERAALSIGNNRDH